MIMPAILTRKCRGPHRCGCAGPVILLFMCRDGGGRVLHKGGRGCAQDDGERVELVEDAVAQLGALLLREVGDARQGGPDDALRLRHAVLQQPARGFGLGFGAYILGLGVSLKPL